MTPPRARVEPDLPIDPRIRERRIEVQREQGRRRLRRILGAMLLSALVVGGLWVLHSPLAGVRRVVVTGRSQLATPALLAAAGIRYHEPLVDVPPAGAERRLEALPWVATARVERRWPTTLRIALTVRQPVGQVPRGSSPHGAVALVDRTGRVVADAATAVRGLPLLRGAGPAVPLGNWLSGSPGATRSAGGRRPGRVGAPHSEAALALAAALDADRLSATDVEVGAHGSASAVIGGGATVVRFGSARDLAAKVRVLLVLSSDGDLRDAGQVDLAVPQRPTVTPRGSRHPSVTTGTSSATASSSGSSGNPKG